ncbi:MAG: hypothetical protein H7232_07950 [Aeromicrobium sp.]|nr:hypothetical protein [Burkholderiales bacterium]
MAEFKPIRFFTNGSAIDESSVESSHEASATRFSRLSLATIGMLTPANQRALASIGELLDVIKRLDATYGADGPLPLDDIDSATDVGFNALAELEGLLLRAEDSTLIEDLDALTLNLLLWAMRHDVQIASCGPAVNTLARRANSAASTQETAAVYAMMQGAIDHFAPQLSADLERSNPDRPWRLLNVNFAITAIRTGDLALMDFAFAKLNESLPDERYNFYTEALAIAGGADFPPALRSAIADQCLQWAPIH